MTKEEYSDRLFLIDMELSEFQEEIKQGTKQEIYDSAYQINFYEEFRQLFLRKGLDYDKRIFPRDNILQHFYQKFCEMPYKETTLPMRMCIEREIERNSKNSDSEM